MGVTEGVTTSEADRLADRPGASQRSRIPLRWSASAGSGANLWARQRTHLRHPSRHAGRAGI